MNVKDNSVLACTKKPCKDFPSRLDYGSHFPLLCCVAMVGISVYSVGWSCMHV